MYISVVVCVVMNVVSSCMVWFIGLLLMGCPDPETGIMGCDQPVQTTRRTSRSKKSRQYESSDEIFPDETDDELLLDDTEEESQLFFGKRRNKKDLYEEETEEKDENVSGWHIFGGFADLAHSIGQIAVIW